MDKTAKEKNKLNYNVTPLYLGELSKKIMSEEKMPDLNKLSPEERNKLVNDSLNGKI